MSAWTKPLVISKTLLDPSESRAQELHRKMLQALAQNGLPESQMDSSMREFVKNLAIATIDDPIVRSDLVRCETEMLEMEAKWLTGKARLLAHSRVRILNRLALPESMWAPR
jgi:hypothetical protein